jgi:sialate O-acetylesterase
LSIGWSGLSVLNPLTPQTDVKVKWSVSEPNVVKTFSAIGYWFGSKLQKELGVPVGIINNSYGGTSIESWLPLETLKHGPWPQDKRTDIDLAKADYDRRKEAIKPTMEKYEAEKAVALREHKPAPAFPSGWPGEFRGPSVLWNGEVAPLLPYRIRGVAWYQGESNAYAGVAQTYKDLLPVLIRDWRQGFGQPDLPFLIFQISRNRKPQTDPNELSGIAELQEAQLKTAQLTPHTALVVTDDLGEPDVHYTNKEPAAERALKAALTMAYGRTIESSGPVYSDMKIDGDKATLRFTHIAGGLVAKDGAPQGFVIAGDDKKFVFADARIEGESIVVSSPQVPQPVAVRYGWADNPKVNLFNKEGLPASPFRTDSWPLLAPAKTKQ